jgi:hypothetical protein
MRGLEKAASNGQAHLKSKGNSNHVNEQYLLEFQDLSPSPNLHCKKTGLKFYNDAQPLTIKAPQTPHTQKLYPIASIAGLN